MHNRPSSLALVSCFLASACTAALAPSTNEVSAGSGKGDESRAEQKRKPDMTYQRELEGGGDISLSIYESDSAVVTYESATGEAIVLNCTLRSMAMLDSCTNEAAWSQELADAVRTLQDVTDLQSFEHGLYALLPSDIANLLEANLPKDIVGARYQANITKNAWSTWLEVFEHKKPVGTASCSPDLGCDWSGDGGFLPFAQAKAKPEIQALLDAIFTALLEGQGSDGDKALLEGLYKRWNDAEASDAACATEDGVTFCEE